jgi:acetate CoA/acetoacetate CoA-transferase alpha subunit
MAAKLMSADEAVALINPGDSIAVSGFLGVGTPEGLVDALVRRGTRPLTLITNDTAYPDRGAGKLIVSRQVGELLVSHIGTNPETIRQMNAGELPVTLIPQGTMIERLRAAGAGLGGVLTPTGIGTRVAEGKRVIEVDGRPYLLETALKPRFGFVKGAKADRRGNLVYLKTARNFNPAVAMAAEVTIAEVDEIVENGDLDPEVVVTPFVFVNILVPALRLSRLGCR